MKNISNVFLKIHSVIIFTVLLSLSFTVGLFSTQNKSVIESLKTYIEKNGKEPVQYMIDKFKQKDVVVLGEFNRLKHEVEFVNSLIPMLYINGIYNLAMEFGNKEDQEKVDRLLTDTYFNKELAMELLRNFKEYGVWGYKEYLDLYRTAWEVNSSLKLKAPKFRIVLLSSSSNYDNPSNVADLLKKNVKMAEVIDKEILSKNQKALVYVTSIHAENCVLSIKSFTSGKVKDMKKIKIAGILSEKYPNKVFSVILHSPWSMVNKAEYKLTGLVKPLSGEIDNVIEMLGYNPVAFDINGSPIKDLSEKKSVYYDMNNKYTVNCICDGYIYLKPYEEYEFVSWIPDFINETNFLEIRDYYKKMNPDLKVESIDYATDLCSANGWSVLEMAKSLKKADFVEYKDLNKPQVIN